MPVSALVMAGGSRKRLEPLLGAEACVRLQSVLTDVACRWAAEVAPGRSYLAGPKEPEIREELRSLADVPGDHGDRLAAATSRVLRERAEPLLVVWTDTPTLKRAHAREAEAVLRGGADVVLGPALGGGLWLVGLARPAPDLFDLGAAWDGPGAVVELLLDRAGATGLRAELLGTQRRLDGPSDARALAARDGLPPEAAGILRAAINT